MAVFPLPNVVLLPGMMLPLHIFEDRYRMMVADVLEDDCMIALALLRPGFENDYDTNQAEIHPVTCVGRVQEHVQIPDGRYFIQLLGLCRARIRQEDRAGAYRLAMLDPMIEPEAAIESDGEFAARRHLCELLASAAFDRAENIEKIRDLVSSNRPLGTVVDMVAGRVLSSEAVEVKQRLLEEMRALRRAETLIRELQLLIRIIETRQHDLDQWPRFGSVN